jgi:hypothetical protein
MQHSTAQEPTSHKYMAYELHSCRAHTPSRQKRPENARTCAQSETFAGLDILVLIVRNRSVLGHHRVPVDAHAHRLELLSALIILFTVAVEEVLGEAKRDGRSPHIHALILKFLSALLDVVQYEPQGLVLASLLLALRRKP